jgi:hypothetical protein
LALPEKLEQCLATISKLYAKQGERSLQEIVVNARAWVNDRQHGTIKTTIGAIRYIWLFQNRSF